MLKIFYDLAVFFEDCYRRINIREYARIRKITPPSASKFLELLHKEGLLNKEREKNYIYYSANRENAVFVGISRLYWLQKFKSTGLIGWLEREYITPTIILFGSLSKAEAKEGSDIDVAVFSITSKQLDPTQFEKRIWRKIQIFTYKTREDVKNKELLNNILNGFMLSGGW